jgi:hypothetical protein
MPSTASANRIHPLCYEHHSEMHASESSSSEDGMTYACEEPECLVQYSKTDGYFLNTQDQFLIKKAPIPPHQYCSKDRYPMYLLEVQLSPLEMSEVQHEPRRWHADLTFRVLNRAQIKRIGSFSRHNEGARAKHNPISCRRRTSRCWISLLTLASPPSAPSS